MAQVIDALQLRGVTVESLGGYLSGLGLLSAVAQKWPCVRALWKHDFLVLAAEQLEEAALIEYLNDEWQPTPYERWWKGNKEVADLRSWEPELTRVRLLDAHIVPKRDRNAYNDLLGTGGNVGKRDFEKLIQECRALVRKPGTKEWLRHTLFGEAAELPALPSTGTWFVKANKAFNSGLVVAREGQLSPWSYLLAMEGALMMQGTAARRLGARSRPYAAFPFVSEAAPPESEGENGAERSEFWAPVWNRSATLEDVQRLIRRGLARVGWRAARAPHDFAVAAITAGAQAGVCGFWRFALRQTTSGNTYEAIPRGSVIVRRGEKPKLAQALVSIADWLSSVPEDRSGQTTRYFGLRAPVNRALLEVAREPKEPATWQTLLRSIADVQLKIDRNRDWRSWTKRVPELPVDVVEKAWSDDSKPPNVEIAISIASVKQGNYLLRRNIFAESDEVSASVVWHSGDPVRALADVLERRLLDADKLNVQSRKRPPLFGLAPCSEPAVDRFCSGQIDAEAIASLVPAFSLVHWTRKPEPEVKLLGASPAFLLQAFLRPLLTPYNLRLAYGSDTLEPDVTRARAIVRLVRAQAWQQAFDIAERAYRTCGLFVVRPSTEIEVNGDLIAAALLIPLGRKQTRTGFRRFHTKTKANTRISS
jgi:CRISPR-associated protein Csx17